MDTDFSMEFEQEATEETEIARTREFSMSVSTTKDTKRTKRHDRDARDFRVFGVFRGELNLDCLLNR